MRTVLFLAQEEGEGLLEFALIIVLMAIVVIAVLTLLSPVIGEWLNNITGSLNNGG